MKQNSLIAVNNNKTTETQKQMSSTEKITSHAD